VSTGAAPRVTALPNGVRVATDPMPGVGWASVQVHVACGPPEEAPAQAGAAHAIEHMLLGRGPGDAAERLRELDRAGSLNAATSRDGTVYEADVLPERLAETLELLGRALTRPTWDEWEVERRVLVEEAHLVRDDPADRAEVLARRALFGGAHPYGRPIEGTPATIGRTGARHLAALHARCYVGARMVVAAAGEVDHEEVRRRTADAFSVLPPGTPRTGRLPPAAPAPGRGERDDGDRTHLVAAAPAPPVGDPGWAALQHVDALLAGMWSGRLTMELRERRGLAYDVWSGGSAAWGAGTMMAGAAAAPENLEEVARLIGAELARLRRGRTDPRDLDTARVVVVDGARMGLLSPAGRAERLGRRLLAGLPVPPAEDEVRALARVTPEGIRDAARATWRPSRTVVVTVGDPPPGVARRLPALLGGGR